MNKVTDYINEELKKMDRHIVATPETREFLDSFSRANQGSNGYGINTNGS